MSSISTGSSPKVSATRYSNEEAMTGPGPGPGSGRSPSGASPPGNGAPPLKGSSRPPAAATALRPPALAQHGLQPGDTNGSARPGGAQWAAPVVPETALRGPGRGSTAASPDAAPPATSSSSSKYGPGPGPGPRYADPMAAPASATATTAATNGGAAPPHHQQRPPPLSSAAAPAGPTMVPQERPGPAAAAARPPPPPAQPLADPAAFARPVKALSGQLVALYKLINSRYCHQRRLATPGPKYNRGYNDKEGHYIVLPGEEIADRYTVQEVLGKGSFGTVLRCYDEKRREAVALKITRHGSNFRSQAKLELDILLKLNENPNLNHLVVKLLKVFDWQSHLVLVFELLSFNLYQLIKCTRYNGVSLELVRKFAYQLVCTLLQLELQKPQPIIHCDIKPENILLRNQNRSGIRLIDFGSACYADRCVHKYIQSRFYRCPEVILYLGYTTAIDRWSLGCVLVELHTGMPLFDGRTEAAQLARFEATLGPVPVDMIAASGKAQKFYSLLPTGGGYQLKEPSLPRRSLESVIGVTTGGPRGSRRGTQGHDEASYREFLDFITQLLRYEPHDRISCQDALRHPFLAPLYLSDQQQRHTRRQQQQQQQEGRGGVEAAGAAAPSGQ